MSSHLLRRPSATNPIHDITPENAGWTYVGFALHRLAPGEAIGAATNNREACLVMVSGRARVSVNAEELGAIGERENPFDGSPASLYVPARAFWGATAETLARSRSAPPRRKENSPRASFRLRKWGRKRAEPARIRAMCATSCRIPRRMPKACSWWR